jgi:hypothetical protein
MSLSWWKVQTMPTCWVTCTPLLAPRAEIRMIAITWSPASMTSSMSAQSTVSNTSLRQVQHPLHAFVGLGCPAADVSQHPSTERRAVGLGATQLSPTQRSAGSWLRRLRWS